MVAGVGVDAAKIVRIERMLRRADAFARRMPADAPGRPRFAGPDEQSELSELDRKFGGTEWRCHLGISHSRTMACVLVVLELNRCSGG